MATLIIIFSFNPLDYITYNPCYISYKTSSKRSSKRITLEPSLVMKSVLLNFTNVLIKKLQTLGVISNGNL
jgi:hypothetical protein